MNVNSNWHPIDQYSDSALARMARNARDMRSGAAIRELSRRAEDLRVESDRRAS